MKMSPHVRLALLSIESYVKEGLVVSVPEGLPAELRTSRAGAFVCIKEYGQLRGCIGTITPTQSCLAEEIVENAISAAVRDPRFLPVQPYELGILECSVDVLCAPELIDDKHLLDLKKYGVIVECGSRRGLLLPDLEGVDTVQDQIDIARRKACIGRDEPVSCIGSRW